MRKQRISRVKALFRDRKRFRVHSFRIQRMTQPAPGSRMIWVELVSFSRLFECGVIAARIDQYHCEICTLGNREWLEFHRLRHFGDSLVMSPQGTKENGGISIMGECRVGAEFQRMFKSTFSCRPVPFI